MVGRVLVGVVVTGVLSLGLLAEPLTILYTNDLHQRFGRLASIERQIGEQRALGDPVLLLDAGDAWQDFRRPLPVVWGADRMVSWMNRVGYDGMALGNHETYLGPRRLEELAEQADFPLLCANLRPERAGTVPFARSASLDVAGIEIRLIGLVTEEWLPYADYPGLRLLSTEEALSDELSTRKPEELIVVVGHVSLDVASAIAATVPEIDVFISGHSHERTVAPATIGDTLIVQSGAFGERLGRLRLEVDPATGEHRFVDHHLLATQQTPTPLGRGLLRLVLVSLATVAAVLAVLL